MRRHRSLVSQLPARLNGIYHAELSIISLIVFVTRRWRRQPGSGQQGRRTRAHTTAPKAVRPRRRRPAERHGTGESSDPGRQRP